MSGRNSIFDIENILQEIGYLLSLNDNKMNLLKLVKELYLIDRLSIAERDSSISGDSYFSLPHGVILSCTFNMLNDLQLSGDNPWGTYLKSEESKYYPDIVLLEEIPDDRLNAKDKSYIKIISDDFRSFGNKEIEDYMHKNLPEWKKPHDSCNRIQFEDIMFALGKTRKEISESKFLKNKSP
jgi:hypothetical protein